MTSNLLLKNCNQQFDDRIQTYGYEDLVFADELKQQESNINIFILITLFFTYNLEDNNTYLRKTQIATKNLINMEKQNILPKAQTKMSKLYHQIKMFHLNGILDIFYNIFNKKITHTAYQKKVAQYGYTIYINCFTLVKTIKCLFFLLSYQFITKQIF